jgi:hypothetical protein
MTRNERLLENLVSALLLPLGDGEDLPLASRVRQAWLRRLKSIYPQLCLKLGRRCEEVFNNYLILNPARSWNMGIFGGDLPKYLKERALQKKTDRYLSELADLEWSLFWVQNVPSVAFGGSGYMVHPFVRYLRFNYGIWEWWKDKSGNPQLKSEMVLVTKGPSGPIVFEPTLVEAAIIDSLNEASLTLDQLVASVEALIQGSQRIQVEVGLNSLLEKGVVHGPRAAPAPGEPDRPKTDD